jgi:thiosulfate/3-mercaptopyruvate sulfurtransferase
MAEAGIGDDDVVVAYDDAGGVVAARLVWMLRATGHPAALLDGGLQAYPGTLETAATVRPAAVFTPTPWPTALLADIEDAVDPRNVVIDARAPERYRGETEPVDPRAGHIPGAHNLPTAASLGPDGRFLAREELRRRFEAVGAGTGRPVISSCGSGVTACHTLLALEHAGLPAGLLYPGSWSQYSNDPDRPVATGADPA